MTNRAKSTLFLVCALVALSIWNEQLHSFSFSLAMILCLEILWIFVDELKKGEMK